MTQFQLQVAVCVSFALSLTWPQIDCLQQSIPEKRQPLENVAFQYLVSIIFLLHRQDDPQRTYSRSVCGSRPRR